MRTRRAIEIETDAASLAELRHLRARTVEVSFDDGTPPLPALAGVHADLIGPNVVRFEVAGSIAPLLDALAGHNVRSLTSREPSLEEIFVHHYDRGGPRVGS